MPRSCLLLGCCFKDESVWQMFQSVELPGANGTISGIGGHKSRLESARLTACVLLHSSPPRMSTFRRSRPKKRAKKILSYNRPTRTLTSCTAASSTPFAQISPSVELWRSTGLELAAVQLGHKRMTTTDEHYNDRDMDDLKKAAELIEKAFGTTFAPDFFAPD